MANLIDRYFTQADLDRIEQAVTAAESRTDGEIALAIRLRSSGWLRDGWLVAGLVGLCAAVGCMVYTQDSGWGMAYDYSFATAVGAVAFVFTYVLLKLPWARTGTSKAVWSMALKHFADLAPTRASTGVLLYISLEEKQVAVVADRAIADKVPPGYWDIPRDLIVAGFAAGRHTDAVIEAVQEVGTHLALHFPRSTDDTNELPNRPQVG
jgi:putative membrane protein